MAKLISDDEEREAFQPYAVEIGFIAKAWNRMHDKLGAIYSQIVSPHYTYVSLKIWHSVPSDRMQRELLRIAYSTKGALNEGKFPQAEESLKWLTAEIQKLADRRNNAIHSPFNVGVLPYENFEISVYPDIFHENPRAARLSGSDILSELRFYRECSEILLQYTTEIYYAFYLGGSWPQKPKMPILGKTQGSKKGPRRKGAKKPQGPRPPSSQA